MVCSAWICGYRLIGWVKDNFSVEIQTLVFTSSLFLGESIPSDMELTIKDRIYLPAFLQKNNSFTEFNVKKSILRKIDIPDQERKEIDLKENQETKRIEWDVSKEQPLLVDFTADELDYLKTSCESISDEKLPDDMWDCVAKVYDAIREP